MYNGQQCISVPNFSSHEQKNEKLAPGDQSITSHSPRVSRVPVWREDGPPEFGGSGLRGGFGERNCESTLLVATSGVIKSRRLSLRLLIAPEAFG